MVGVSGGRAERGREGGPAGDGFDGEAHCVAGVLGGEEHGDADAGGCVECFVVVFFGGLGGYRGLGGVGGVAAHGGDDVIVGGRGLGGVDADEGGA